MKPALFVRPVTEQEHQRLKAHLRSTETFRLRRAQILLASARGLRPSAIAQTYGGSVQTVRNVIHAFNADGLACLTRQSNRPKRIKAALNVSTLAQLHHLLHQSPRIFGKPTSIWTQTLLAEVAYAEGLTDRVVSDETMRRALTRLGANWKRAKQWITSPDPAYARKKSGVTG